MSDAALKNFSPIPRGFSNTIDCTINEFKGSSQKLNHAVPGAARNMGDYGDFSVNFFSVKPNGPSTAFLQERMARMDLSQTQMLLAEIDEIMLGLIEVQ